MKTNPIKWLCATLMCGVVVACVTINVYFPEAAAEEAADRFIRDVIGEPAEPQASLFPPARRDTSLAGRLLDVLIPSAHAQGADIDIESPQINAIKARMSERHAQRLAEWFDAGAIGFGNDGLVEIRDRSAVGLSERRELEQVVAEENADRRAVYREIAVANGQPDWEDDIRETFARRWIANARTGWYYQDASGSWQRK